MKILRKKDIIDKSFAKGVPTVFILDSPFQVICAHEAISEFLIDDYLIIAALPHDDSRNEQVISMLSNFSLPYEIVWVDDVVERVWVDPEVFTQPVPRKFKRVVIGDYYAMDQWVLCTRYADQNSVLFFLDDGASTLPLLKGEFVRDEPHLLKDKWKWYKQVYRPRMALQEKIMTQWHAVGLNNVNCIYTIYADYHSSYFHTYPNTLSNLVANVETIKDVEHAIYIIGTYANAYANAFGLKISEYESILWRLMADLRRQYPTKKIVYIPHGRDNNTVIISFCKILDIDYKRLDHAVEYMFAYKGLMVADSIYGFGSTALYTLKIIMPHAKVVNWLIDNRNALAYNDYQHIAKYYQKHGIILCKVPYPNISLFRRCRRFIKWLIGVDK